MLIFSIVAIFIIAVFSLLLHMSSLCEERIKGDIGNNRENTAIVKIATIENINIKLFLKDDDMQRRRDR